MDGSRRTCLVLCSNRVAFAIRFTATHVNCAALAATIVNGTIFTVLDAPVRNTSSSPISPTTTSTSIASASIASASTSISTSVSSSPISSFASSSSVPTFMPSSSVPSFTSSSSISSSISSAVASSMPAAVPVMAPFDVKALSLSHGRDSSRTASHIGNDGLHQYRNMLHGRSSNSNNSLLHSDRELLVHLNRDMLDGALCDLDQGLLDDWVRAKDGEVGFGDDFELHPGYLAEQDGEFPFDLDEDENFFKDAEAFA
ncbi:hypothetical protein M413DRAFT_266912 [Hebeloma cylindrosporum]|uniref:Uncharacterized protein n=1 Tax=Hebeloma cylindrosporum TaxID=76867 RepID=A0A0C3CSC2_HEBCY|nr:hypothetical protein M413DRAFT_266912 [Hebeloma cylindrosporum h7]